MATVSTEQKTMERGGWPALGPKVGYVEAEVTLTNGASANDRVGVFNFEARTLVMALGLQIVSPCANAVTASAGAASEGAGSATTLLGEVSVDDALVSGVGLSYSGGEGLANVIVDADDPVVLELSGDPGAGGTVRVFAVVADISDVSGV